MTSRTIVKHVKELKAELQADGLLYIDYIAGLVYESLMKFNNNQKFDNRDRVICGLRYPEFFINHETEGNSDERHILAEQQKRAALEILGITSNDLYDRCLALFGLH